MSARTDLSLADRLREKDPYCLPEVCAVVEAAESYRVEFAKRGYQTHESMAAWDAMSDGLAALDRRLDEKGL